MSRILGIRNIVTVRTANPEITEPPLDDWKFLVFYDIDRGLEPGEYGLIETYAEEAHTSYLLIMTKHGYHFVGLSPLSAKEWAHAYDQLKQEFKSYYSGQVLRLSLKKDEKQKLVQYQLRYPVVPSLLMMYSKRFNDLAGEIASTGYKPAPGSYRCVFESYRSFKK